MWRTTSKTRGLKKGLHTAEAEGRWPPLNTSAISTYGRQWPRRGDLNLPEIDADVTLFIRSAADGQWILQGQVSYIKCSLCGEKSVCSRYKNGPGTVMSASKSIVILSVDHHVATEASPQFLVDARCRVPPGSLCRQPPARI